MFFLFTFFLNLNRFFSFNIFQINYLRFISGSGSVKNLRIWIRQNYVDPSDPDQQSLLKTYKTLVETYR